MRHFGQRIRPLLALELGILLASFCWSYGYKFRIVCGCGGGGAPPRRPLGPLEHVPLSSPSPPTPASDTTPQSPRYGCNAVRRQANSASGTSSGHGDLGWHNGIHYRARSRFSPGTASDDDVSLQTRPLAPAAALLRDGTMASLRSTSSRVTAEPDPVRPVSTGDRSNV